MSVRKQHRNLLAAQILGGLALLLWPLTSLGRAPGVPTDITFRASAEFRVTATRLLFRSSRQVQATATLRGLDGHVDVTLNKPVKCRLGVKQLVLTLRAMDADGNQVGASTVEVGHGERAFSFDLELPGPGSYRLVLSDIDVDAGPATVKIHPGGSAVLDVVAGSPQWLALDGGF